MEDTKEALMVAAMAYRVKYRSLNDNGRVKKVFLPVEILGVHPKNRGGVYPAGIRCRRLCQEVVPHGFLKEEISHACVAVEGAPDGQMGQSLSTFNAACSSKDELLATCF